MDRDPLMLQRYSIWALVVWTGFLWLSRLRNVLANDDLTTGGRLVRIGVVVIFVGLATVVFVLRRHRLFGQFALVLVVWTVGYWLVRGGGILIGDYDVGFKVVHTVLMVVSIGLGLLAWATCQNIRAVVARR